MRDFYLRSAGFFPPAFLSTHANSHGMFLFRFHATSIYITSIKIPQMHAHDAQSSIEASKKIRKQESQEVKRVQRTTMVSSNEAMHIKIIHLDEASVASRLK